MSPRTRTDSPAELAPQHLCFRSVPNPLTAPCRTDVRHAVFAFPPELVRVPEVRHSVTAVLEYWGADDDLCATAPLIASELVTNSVIHASASPEITLLVEYADGVHIAVRDTSPGLPASRAGLPGEAESGRGLTLIAALSAAWGTTVYGDGSKVVWANLAL
ncbi:MULTISPECIES: ATP-binding protein [Streptomyces]|uniref:ATP-binding protein n=1 Tax=Streptomyces TaxID=1883 RepID=UPI000E30B20B|nr:ATP-binding protein [Streptomyces sp. AcE210]RFC71145.1 ATP-binding protein [Streptomyces sp. AcE210]